MASRKMISSPKDNTPRDTIWNLRKSKRVTTKSEERKIMPNMEECAIQEVFADFIHQIETTKMHRTRFIDVFPLNKKVRQGDVYITRVADDHPHGGRVESRQLAIGNTQGSRHMAGDAFEIFEGTTLPEGVEDGTFLGPCIKTETRELVKHPEHCWFSIPAGTYQVTHQTDILTRERRKD